jgi:tartrate-resistant acid phosphatase type 5
MINFYITYIEERMLKFGGLKVTLLLCFFILITLSGFSQTRFAVIGDYGNGKDYSEGLIANIINNWGVDFIVTVGDNFYDANDGNYSDTWDAIDNDVAKYFHNWIGNLPVNSNFQPGSSTNKFFPAMGNHDFYHIDSSNVYTDYFTLPGVDFSNSSWNERYYDFIWENVHFFMLDNYGLGLSQYNFPRHGNSGEPDGVDENSTQATWFFTQIDNCVNNHSSHWRIVIAHIPPYSSGTHGSDPGIQWPYKQHGAHLVISGHDHVYERLVINDLTYIINGLSGKSKGSFGTPISGSLVRYNSNYGAMLFETIGDTKLRGQFIDVNGSTWDDFTLVDSALPVELVFLTANLNGNNIDLCWRTETEVNNYGFDIERTENKTNWQIIGFVEGNGNSNSPKQYNFSDTDIVQSGTYYYRLKQIDNDGTYEYSDVVNVEVDIPNKFYLSQNYPNPFNPETRIDFTLPKKQQVSLKIYNTLGELVGELVNEVKKAGSYSVTFNASNLPSGVYIYRLKSSGFVQNKKMTFLK